MTKQTFLIKYRDPEDGSMQEVEKEFEGDFEFTPRRWAEDCAYNLADKGWYEVIEVKP